MPDPQIQMSAALPRVRRKCAACEQAGHKCAACEEEDRVLQKKSIGAELTGGGEAPEFVHGALRTPGQPLDADSRAFFESRFRYDFGSVRVHTNQEAAQSAGEIGARAYTVGSDIVFGENQHATSSVEGRRLLAHELAHVVQQGAAGTRLAVRRSLAVADTLQRVSRRVQRQPVGCLKLLKAKGKSNPALGEAVEIAIRSDFRRRVGTPAKFTLPDASAAPSRTENPRKPNEIPPEVFSFFSGMGKPDLAFRRPGSPVMLMAEIKPANYFGLAFAEGQLAKYIDKGNENEQLKAELGVKVFVPMTPLTYTPPRTMQVAGKKVTVMWCGPGVIVYKAVEEEEDEKKKKKKKKKDEEEKKKKKKKKGKKEEEEKEEKKKKKKKKGDEEEEEEEKKGGKEAGNVGFGIGVLSSGSGGRNATLGVAINSHGSAYGTASAGVVYDSNGNAIASASAGAGAHVSGNVAGTAGAGAGESTSTDAALSATAGAGQDTSSEALATASAGTAERTDTVSIAAASHGHSEDVAGTTIAKAGKASGGAGTEGSGKAGAQGGSSVQGGTGAGGLQIPGQSAAQTQTAVKQAQEIDAMLQKSSDAQKELLAYLAQSTGNMEYEVPDPEWVKKFLAATNGLKADDIAFLEKQKWVPGEVSAEELRRKIEERLKNRDKPQSDAAKAGTGKPEQKAGTESKPPDTGTAAPDAGTTTPVKEKPEGVDDKLSAASLDKPSSTAPKKVETNEEAFKRLYKRTQTDWPKLRTEGGVDFKEKIYDKTISGAFYYMVAVHGKQVRFTADVAGILRKEGDHDVFEIRSSSIIVSSKKDVAPGSRLVGKKLKLHR
jgi:outer membrane biosynthesis protein TonB